MLWQTLDAEGALCDPTTMENVAVVVFGTLFCASILSCLHDNTMRSDYAEIRGFGRKSNDSRS